MGERCDSGESPETLALRSLSQKVLALDSRRWQDWEGEVLGGGQLAWPLAAQVQTIAEQAGVSSGTQPFHITGHGQRLSGACLGGLEGATPQHPT